MKEVFILICGFAAGWYLKTNSEERKALRKENEFLKASRSESKE